MERENDLLYGASKLCNEREESRKSWDKFIRDLREACIELEPFLETEKVNGGEKAYLVAGPQEFGERLYFNPSDERFYIRQPGCFSYRMVGLVLIDPLRNVYPTQRDADHYIADVTNYLSKVLEKKRRGERNAN